MICQEVEDYCVTSLKLQDPGSMAGMTVRVCGRKKTDDKEGIRIYNRNLLYHSFSFGEFVASEIGVESSGTGGYLAIKDSISGHGLRLSGK